MPSSFSNITLTPQISKKAIFSIELYGNFCPIMNKENNTKSKPISEISHLNIDVAPFITMEFNACFGPVKMPSIMFEEFHEQNSQIDITCSVYRILSRSHLNENEEFHFVNQQYLSAPSWFACRRLKTIKMSKLRTINI